MHRMSVVRGRAPRLRHRSLVAVSAFAVAVSCALVSSWPLAAPAARAAASGAPSRPPDKNCRWEKLADPVVGLAAWVERCDYGFRKIDFLFQGRSLAIRYSDGGAPEPVIDVLDLQPGETVAAGLRRVFDANTDRVLAARCVLAPYRGVGEKRPAGAKRYTFVPEPKYAKELRKKADPNEVGDPPCGDWGDAPDGIQYFEVPAADAGARRVLFVRVGQDTPLFDERTLRVLAAPAK